MQPKPTTRVVTKSWTARKLLREMEEPEQHGAALKLAFIVAVFVLLVIAACR